jgi:hypothetical protein
MRWQFSLKERFRFCRTLVVFSLERFLISVKPFYFRERVSAVFAKYVAVVLFFLVGTFTIFNIVESYFKLTHKGKSTPWLESWKETQQRAEVSSARKVSSANFFHF